MDWKDRIKLFDNAAKFNIIQFKFGKEQRDIKHYAKLGVILRTTIALIAWVPGLNEEKVFNFIDELQLALDVEFLNDYIVKDIDLLKYRIKRVLDKALEEYKKKNEN
jgi:hypothetical protein